MAYTARSRDRFKALTALVTGVTTFAGVGVAGAATGLAARDTASGDQADQQLQAAQQWLRTRPHRTVVRTTVVHRASRSGATTVGPGGTLSAAPPATSWSSSVPVAPPQPPPAPTSGS